MTPLEIRILMGAEDNNLLKLIERLEYIKSGKDGGCGLSDREQKTLQMAYTRLDEITK